VGLTFLDIIEKSRKRINMLHLHSYYFKGQTLSFEPEFSPRIYIIGGQNGCGKTRFVVSLFALVNGRKLDHTDIRVTFTKEGGEKKSLQFGYTDFLFNGRYTPEFSEVAKRTFIFTESDRSYLYLSIWNNANAFSYKTTDSFWKGSRGERKRELIKSMLKRIGSKPAIILMDDLDSGLHPDWQYQIIRDLQDWAPQHQYIITSHSYEMCEALTPAHIKELV
jgi:predicted ATPase